MTIAYSEIGKHAAPAGNPVLDQWLGEGQFVGRRWVLTAWADRYSLVDEKGAMNGGAGELWPYRPNTGAYLHAARCVGHGRVSFDASGLANYEGAMIELYYSTMAPVVFQNQYVITESIEPMKQHMTFAAEDYGLRWGATDGELIKGWLTHVDCRMVYVLSFHNIMGGPVAALGYIGQCNAAAVATLTLGVTFNAQTLLHADPYIHRTIRPGFLPRYTLRYRWPFHPQGWNTKWNPKTAAWTTVYSSTGQIMFHPPCNFQNLFP